MPLSSSHRPPGLLARVTEGFAFSGGLAAAIGAALSSVASHTLSAPDALTWAFLTAAGTFIVYALDRLRDIDRDQASSPLRTAFVVRNRNFLYSMVGITAIGFGIAILTAPASILVLCGIIGGIGLLHRRLKDHAALKAAYVSLAWVMTCVGIPWLASGRPALGLWLASIMLAALSANLVASNLQEHKPGSPSGFDPIDDGAVLWGARAIALIGILLALIAPAAMRPLVWIPVCEALALVGFRSTERYSQFAIDGGLLIGAIASGIHFGVIG
jgi:hypothetical protein